MKSVFTIQPIKLLVSLSVKSAEPAATFLLLILRTKNRHLWCLAVRVHIVLQGRRIATINKKNHLHFWRNFSANHNQAHPNLNQKRLKWVQIWNKTFFLSIGRWFLSDIFIFQIIFFSISIYSQPLKFNQPTYRKAWPSQSQTTESSRLLILLPTLLLLQ